MLHRISHFLLDTLRGRLILSVALIHAIMMTLFIVDLTVRQRAMLLNNQTEAAVAMSQSLATSTAGWVVANDLSGLQEIVEAQRRYPELSFVMLMDETGHILAHTDKSKIGLYILDLPSSPQLTVIHKSAALVDVAVPVMLNDNLVGWARVGLGQQSAAQKLAAITFAGALYALAAIVIGSLIAWRMGSRITQRLYAVQNTISEVKKGNHLARAKISGKDEASVIALEFNAMLDALAARESELWASENRFKKLFNAAAVPLCFVNQDGVLANANKHFFQTFGYTHDEVPTLTEWWQLAYPDLEYRKWAVATWNEAVRKAADQNADIEPIEYNVVCKSGEVRAMIISGTMLDHDLLASFFDITERKQATDALQEQERRSQSLLRLSKKLESAQTYISALSAAYEEVKTVIGYQNLWVYLLSEDGKSFQSLVASGDMSATVMSENGTATLPIEGDPMLEEIAAAREIVLIEDALTDPRTNKELVRKLGNRTLVNVPILLFDRHLGSVGMGTFGDEGIRVPTRSEQEYLKSMASHLAVTLDRIHLLDKRKQMEQKLVAREREYRVLVENIPDLIVRYDKELRRLYVNPAWERASGLSAEEVVNVPPVNIPKVPQPVHVEYLEKLKQAQKTGQSQKIEFDWINASGVTLSLEYVIVPEYDWQGNIRGVLSVGRDITERKQAEEEIRKSNALLERIFSSTEFMIAYLDADFNFIRVNRAYAEADGRPPEFFIGKNHFDLFPHVENESIFRHVVETGEPYIAYAKPFEYAEYPERGVSYWNWTLQPVKESGGRVTALVFSLIDVTERERAIIAQHESEIKLRAIFNSSVDAIGVSKAGIHTFVNPAYLALFGYAAGVELIERPIFDLIAPSCHEQIMENVRRRASGQSTPVVYETRGLRKDGSEFDMDVHTSTYELNGEIYTVVILRDITERKRNEIEREAIITVSNALRKATTLKQIFTVILDEILKLFNAEGAILAMPHPSGESIIAQMGRGIIGERFTNVHIPKGKGMAGWAIENKKNYLNNQANADPLFYLPELLGTCSCAACVPLIAQEQAIGALWIAREKNIAEQDLLLLNAIADIAANAIHRVTLYEQTEQQLHHLVALHQIDLAITTSFDLNITLDVLLNSVKSELRADAACILLLDPITYNMEYAAGIGFKTRHIEKSLVNFGDEYAGRAALEQRTIACPDLKSCHHIFSRAALLADEAFTAYYVTPLLVKGQVKGVLEVFHRSMFRPDTDWTDYFETLATQAAIAIENASLLENLQRSNMELMLAYDATIEGWSRALDLRDNETEGHTQRVTEMALRLAEKLSMSDAEKLNLRRGALLHDIGKMGVPDSILLKPGKLTDKEWEIMRRHPDYAYEMLSPITYLRQALDIPYCHHEKWDGSGYPRGLKEEAIPLPARVFAVADVFDALISNRPYSPPWTRTNAMEYIRQQSGSYFDPVIVKAFLELEDLFYTE